MSLHARIAARLGWTEEEARGFSLHALRDVVRPASLKLAAEISSAIASGGVVTRPLCTLCGRRPATRAAGKSGRAGTDFCDACWREEFTDPRGDL